MYPTCMKGLDTWRSCSHRDLNPGLKLEKLASLTGLDYGSIIQYVEIEVKNL